MQSVVSASKELNGLMPVNNFNPTLFTGHYYELMRLLPDPRILFGIGLEGTSKHPWTNVTWNIVPEKNNSATGKLSTTVMGFSPPLAVPSPVTANAKSALTSGSAFSGPNSSGNSNGTSTSGTNSNGFLGVNWNQIGSQISSGFQQFVGALGTAENQVATDFASAAQNLFNNGTFGNVLNSNTINNSPPKQGTWKTKKGTLTPTITSGVYNSSLGDFAWLVPEKYVILDAGYITTNSNQANNMSTNMPVDMSSQAPNTIPSTGMYDYAIIGTPNRHNLWLLARSPTALTTELQGQYAKIAQANQYPATTLARAYVVPQSITTQFAGDGSVGDSVYLQQ